MPSPLPATAFFAIVLPLPAAIPTPSFRVTSFLLAVLSSPSWMPATSPSTQFFLTVFSLPTQMPRCSFSRGPVLAHGVPVLGEDARVAVVVG